MRIRVAFDDQIFIAQKRGGISKYFVELISRLPDYGVDPVLAVTSTSNLHLLESNLAVTEASPVRPMVQKMQWVSWRLLGRPRQDVRRKSNIDIIHYTFTNKWYLNKTDCKTVTTIFDMTPELFPQYFPLGNPHLAKKKYCEEMDGLISISESTSKDLTQIYKKDFSNKTRVIPFGVGGQFFEKSDLILDLPYEYVLFVGVRKGYKGFRTAVEAFSFFSQKRPEVKFLFVGGGEFTDEEISLAKAFGVIDSLIHMKPSDNEIVQVYAQASCFIFPSEYEGFGLPTLEALATGTPCVLADNSCMREVGGDVALYFRTGDSKELASQIEIAISNESKSQVSIAGPRHARNFSWDKTASDSADFYRELID